MFCLFFPQLVAKGSHLEFELLCAGNARSLLITLKLLNPRLKVSSLGIRAISLYGKFAYSAFGFREFILGLPEVVLSLLVSGIVLLSVIVISIASHFGVFKFFADIRKLLVDLRKQDVFLLQSLFKRLLLLLKGCLGPLEFLELCLHRCIGLTPVTDLQGEVGEGVVEEGVDGRLVT
ncbi:hypothetical protein COL154_000642 [Colletotrichum chrysophilum]|nr:hypothetical protein COL154_000642 [Colletotrichum chrysophilum]